MSEDQNFTAAILCIATIKLHSESYSQLLIIQFKMFGNCV